MSLTGYFVRDLITGDDPATQAIAGVAVILGVCLLAVMYLATLPWRTRRSKRRIEVLRSYCNDEDARSQIDTLVNNYGSLRVANDGYLGRAISRMIESPDRPYNRLDIESALSAYST